MATRADQPRRPRPPRTGRGSPQPAPAPADASDAEPPPRPPTRSATRPQAEAPGPSALAALAAQVAVNRALVQLAQAVRRTAALAEAPTPTHLTFTLDVAAPEQAEAFLRAARDAAEAARPADTLWRDGALYCFQCNSTECRHAAPATADSVFVGYAPTGKPEWRPFVETCVARRLPGVDRLFNRPPGVVAYVQRSELTAELLPAFGQDNVNYAVLGQAVVGLLPPRWLNDAGERTVLTVQVVRARRPGEAMQLRLNLLGLPSEAVLVAAADDAPRGPAERLRRLLQRTRAQLGSLARRAENEAARGAPFDPAGSVSSILSHLRGDLVRVFEPDDRRTRHAEDRHQGGERPTDTVWRDARHAGDDRLFWDAHQETVVVTGPRGRAHVFNGAAQHVTSLRLEPGELERKVAQGRWRALPPTHQGPFRAAVAAQIAGAAGAEPATPRLDATRTPAAPGGPVGPRR